MLSKLATLFTVFVAAAVAQQPSVHLSVDSDSLNSISQRWNQAGVNLVNLQSQASQNISANISDVIDQYQGRFENITDRIRELNQRTMELLAEIAGQVVEEVMEAVELEDMIDNLFDAKAISLYYESRCSGNTGGIVENCNSTACYDCCQMYDRYGIYYTQCSIQEQYYFSNSTGYYDCHHNSWETTCTAMETYYFCNDTSCYNCDNYTDCTIETKTYSTNEGVYVCTQNNQFNDKDCELAQDYFYCNYDTYNCYTCTNQTDCEFTSFNYFNDTDEACYNSTLTNGTWVDSSANSCINNNDTGSYYCYKDHWSYDGGMTCEAINNTPRDKVIDALTEGFNATYGNFSYVWSDPEFSIYNLREQFEQATAPLKEAQENATAWFLFRTSDALNQLATDLQNNTVPLMAKQVVAAEKSFLTFYSNSLYIFGMPMVDLYDIFPNWHRRTAYNNAIESITDYFIDPIYDLADYAEDEGLDIIWNNGIQANQIVVESSEESISSWNFGLTTLTGAAAICTMAVFALKSKRADSDEYERIL